MKKHTTLYNKMKTNNVSKMLHALGIIFVFSFLQNSFAQSNNHNYIATKVYMVPSTNPDLETIGQVQKTVTYYDGLGRVKQVVEVAASKDQKSVLTPVEYDAVGRQVKNYLPYTANTGSANFMDNLTILQKGFYGTLYPNQNAFTETVFDDSPLNRIIEQVSPGMVKGGNTVKLNYYTNAANEVKRWDVNITNNNLEYKNFYNANTLYKNEVKDENHNRTHEFKDLQGRVLLKRAFVDSTTSYDTYYVYDDFGMLRYVLSPEGSSQMTGNSYSPSSDLVKKYCYYYEYNQRRLLIKKQLPGADVVTMEYDERDRLRFSTDGNQRLKNQKIEFVYDGLNRPTGSLLWGPIVEAPGGPVGIGKNQTQSPMHNKRLLEKMVYDNYDSVPSILNFVPVSGMGTYFVKSNKVLGMLTYDKKAILETPDKYIETAYYYDKYGRLIQSVSTNHLDGIDVVSMDMDFAGRTLKTVTTHSSIYNTGGLTITDSLTYDHMGRPINSVTKVNNLSALRSATNVYDNLGRLDRKRFLQLPSTAFKQTQIYKYNIRGWLTQINDPSSFGSTYFAQRLRYNETGTQYPQHNGNISEEEFRTSALGQVNKYVYRYDGINRLTSATFTPSARYNMSWTYDRNGNITNQKRSGLPQNPGFGGSTFRQVENLTYIYSGNQLDAVNNRENYHLPNGFKDLGPGRSEYFYDVNGNLIKDLNQNLERIAYNSLNLPIQIDFMSVEGVTKDNFIQYQYRSDGVKLGQKVYTNAEAITTRDYCGRFVYENQELSYIIFSEGSIRVSKINPGDPNNPEFIAPIMTRSGTQQYGLTREFHLKDHLGNVRVVFNTSGILSENHYYPFGLPIHNLSTSTSPAGKENRYLYNGKELQDDLGLNWMDYGARFYDAGLGRWHSVDPLAEAREWLSPYNYVQNNPISRTDPDGRLDDWVMRDNNIVFDASINGPSDINPLSGDIYLGKSGWSLTDYYHSDGNISPISFTLAEVEIKGEMSRHAKVMNNEITQAIHNGTSAFLRGSIELTAHSLSTTGDIMTVAGTSVVAIPGLQPVGAGLISAGNVTSNIGTGINLGLNVYDGDVKKAIINGASLGLSYGAGRAFDQAKLPNKTHTDFLKGISNTQIMIFSRIANWGIDKKEKKHGNN